MPAAHRTLPLSMRGAAGVQNENVGAVSAVFEQIPFRFGEFLMQSSCSELKVRPRRDVFLNYLSAKTFASVFRVSLFIRNFAP